MRSNLLKKRAYDIMATMHMTVRYTAVAATLLAVSAVSAGSSAPASAADRVVPAESAAVPGEPPVAAPARDGFRLSYDVYKSGFRALSLNFDVVFDGTGYRTDARLESAGIIGWLFEWRLDAVSKGQLQDTAVVPPAPPLRQSLARQGAHRRNRLPRRRAGQGSCRATLWRGCAARRLGRPVARRC